VGCSVAVHKLCIGGSAVLRVLEGVEEEGIQRSGSKQQVEVTHEAKGGVYGAEEMGMLH
jgi:hypothetical protein